MTLPLSSITHDIAEIGQLIQQSQVRTPIQTSITVAPMTSPITFGTPQQISTLKTPAKEYHPTTTSMIVSPTTMSPTIAPSIPTTFSHDYDPQSIKHWIVNDSLLHPERKHLISQSRRKGVSFGNNVHPDRQALIGNLLHDIIHNIQKQ